MQAVTLSWVADVKSFVTWTGGRVEPAGMLSRGARQGRVSVKNRHGPGGPDGCHSHARRPCSDEVLTSLSVWLNGLL